MLLYVGPTVHELPSILLLDHGDTCDQIILSHPPSLLIFVSSLYFSVTREEQKSRIDKNQI